MKTLICIHIEDTHLKEDEDEFETPFSIETYNEVHLVLKIIQTAFKASLINVEGILRGIKKYLEIIEIAWTRLMNLIFFFTKRKS